MIRAPLVWCGALVALLSLVLVVQTTAVSISPPNLFAAQTMQPTPDQDDQGSLGFEGSRCVCSIQTVLINNTDAKSIISAMCIASESFQSKSKYDMDCVCFGVSSPCFTVDKAVKALRVVEREEYLEGICDLVEVGDRSSECLGEGCEGKGVMERIKGFHATASLPRMGIIGERCGFIRDLKKCTNKRECNCEVGPWGQWSKCQGVCGMGIMTRTRSVTQEPSLGGAPCQPTVEEADCFVSHCPRDCQMTEWSEWSNCSSSCGPGRQSRNRTVLAHDAHGGIACGPTVQYRDCNAGPNATQCNATTDPILAVCEFSQWSAWSNCSASCDGGDRYRTRTVLKGDLAICVPHTVETETCNTKPCAVDCVLSEWSTWSRCTQSCGGGVRHRSRSVLFPPSNGGRECPSLREYAPCNTHECPVDCVVGDWSLWSDCTGKCGHGMQIRSRPIRVHPANGGKPCPSLVEDRECLNAPCPALCNMSSWEPWTECSVPCGGGFHERHRHILAAPAELINPATHLVDARGLCGETVQYSLCNNVACPVDCQVGPWQEWSECSQDCDGGFMTRTRNVTRPPSNGGRGCPPVSEVTECNLQPCKTNCRVGPWSEWTPCIGVCGFGRQTRSRSVVINPAHGGDACPDLQEIRQCQMPEACPTNCVYTDWSDWGNCTVPCGGGLQKRIRSAQLREELPPRVEERVRYHIVVINGTNVTTNETYTVSIPQSKLVEDVMHQCADLEQVRPCNRNRCPVNCHVSQYDEWEPCSQPCGSGFSSRRRYIIQGASDDGFGCPALQERKSCNTFDCPTDCLVSEWSSWSPCHTNSTCGQGVQFRTRTVLVAAASGGKACPILEETRNCLSRVACPLECAAQKITFSPFSPWTTCSAQCGGGQMNRTRHLIREPVDFNLTQPVIPAPGYNATQAVIPSPALGNETHPAMPVALLGDHGECGALVQSLPCNTHPCPVDCEVSEWSEWSECSSCKGKRKRTRKVLTPDSNGGLYCPELVEVQDCSSTEDCQVDRGCVYGNWTEWDMCEPDCVRIASGKRRREKPALYRKNLSIDQDDGPDAINECSDIVQEADCVLADPDFGDAKGFLPSDVNYNVEMSVRVRVHVELRRKRYDGTECPIAKFLDLED